MRMERFSIWVCLVGMFFVTTVRADFLANSAGFDKAYIPALALTSQGEAEKSKVAMARLDQAWHFYSNAHRQDNPGDESWMKGFVEIEQWIREADTVVASGGKLIDAHNVLEHVRISLMQLRQNHGVDYYPDHLTAFHEPMEEIVLAAKGKTPATFTEQDLAKIRNTIPALEARWSAVRKARFDPANYGLDTERAAKVKRFLELETEAMETLKKALSGSDKAAMIQSAVAIKPPYAQLYMLFGEFAP